jgi:hypothetical protein
MFFVGIILRHARIRASILFKERWIKATSSFERLCPYDEIKALPSNPTDKAGQCAKRLFHVDVRASRFADCWAIGTLPIQVSKRQCPA